MARKPEVHTVPNPNGNGWVNEVGGKEVSHHRTKETAVDRGRDLAQQLETKHPIQNLKGRIGEKNSYGNDPFPPRDKD